MKSFAPKRAIHQCGIFHIDITIYICSCFIPRMRYISHLSTIILSWVENKLEIIITSISTFFQNALYPYGDEGQILHKMIFYENINQ